MRFVLRFCFLHYLFFFLSFLSIHYLQCVKIAQWYEPHKSETCSCQLSIEDDESEDKRCVWLAMQLGQRERFKASLFLSTHPASLMDEEVYRMGFISA